LQLSPRVSVADNDEVRSCEVGQLQQQALSWWRCWQRWSWVQWNGLLCGVQQPRWIHDVDSRHRQLHDLRVSDVVSRTVLHPGSDGTRPWPRYVYARDALHSAVIAVVRCLSVCLSVTRQYYV